MAGIIDDEDVKEIHADNLLEDVSEEIQEEQPKVEDELPEKYRGKSVSEIVRMHQEAEKLIGKQGSEVGELRKVVDDFIRSQTSSKPQEKQEVEEVDFYADPEKAINKAVENHPSVKEAKEAALQMKRAEVLNKLSQKHPNYTEIVSDPSFGEWIKASKVRTELFVRAETNFDYDSADELFSLWEERKNVSNKIAETSKVDRELQLKAADVGSNSTSKITSKKKYRRADIIKLMQTDPQRYESLQPEIMQAYAEGRVI
jgi:hypothetical protein